jgi:hypothetical protein
MPVLNSPELEVSMRVLVLLPLILQNSLLVRGGGATSQDDSGPSLAHSSTENSQNNPSSPEIESSPVVAVDKYREKVPWRSGVSSRETELDWMHRVIGQDLNLEAHGNSARLWTFIQNAVPDPLYHWFPLTIQSMADTGLLTDDTGLVLDLLYKSLSLSIPKRVLVHYGSMDKPLAHIAWYALNHGQTELVDWLLLRSNSKISRRGWEQSLEK